MDLEATAKHPKHQRAEYCKFKHSEKASRRIDAPDLVDRIAEQKPAIID